MNLGWFPVLMTFLTAFTCFLTYVLAVYYKKVNSILPYISDCGADPPQAAYFTELIVISTLIFVCTGTLRHFQIRTLVNNEEHCLLMELTEQDRQRINWWSNVSVILGFLVSLSLLTLASFRVTEMFRFHTLAAIPFFACGPVLYGIQTWISFRFEPHINSRFVSYFRLMLTITAILSLIVFVVFTVWSYFLFNRDWRQERQFWTSDDDGYVQHVIACSGEWVYVLVICPFFITFVPEYRRLQLVQTASFKYVIEGSVTSQPSSEKRQTE